MSKPTHRALLADAERILRALVDREGDGDLYIFDDVRDWLRSREGMRKGMRKS